MSGTLRPGTARANGERGSHDQTGQRLHARRGSHRRPNHTTRDTDYRRTHRGDRPLLWMHRPVPYNNPVVTRAKSCRAYCGIGERRERGESGWSGVRGD